MNAIAHLHFLRPMWLLLLLALPLLWWVWRTSSSDAGAWRGAVDAHLLPHLLERGETRRGAGIWLAATIWIVLGTALAGPAWEREPQPLYRNEAARVLALELSQSMLSQDIKPSRLERARFKLDDILTRSADMQTALIAYAGDAFVAAPLTDDVNTVRNLVDSLAPDTMPVPGNATARAIDKAMDLVHQAGLGQGQLVILADGIGEDAIAAARKAHANGLQISVLGIGSDHGAPVPLAGGGFLKDASGNIIVPHLDETRLRALAAAGGGRYARLTADGSDLDALLADQGVINKGGSDEANADTEIKGVRWRDRGPWLLLLALPLALAAFRRGWLMVLALAFVLPAPPAQALSFTDLWLRADQQAAAALAADDAKKASEVARAPEWRGAAAYRSGDYAAAEKAYASAGETASAAYNRGNALAKQDHYEDAIGAYDDALKHDPDMADAQANKAAVEAWLKQQKQQSPQQQDQQQDGKQGDSQKPEQSPSSSGSGANQKPDSGSDQQNRSDENGSNEGKSGGEDQQDKSNQQQKGSEEPSSADESKAKPDGDSQASGSDKSPESTDQANTDQGSANQGSPGDAQQKPSEAQQQALSKDVDQALGKAEGAPGERSKAQALALSPEDRADQEKQQALEQWLQRVPDDPGGLLRRKFLLEYQQRQRDGGGG